MRFESVFSSSHGNVYLLDDGHTRILIECGVSYKQLTRALGFRLTEVQGVLISHEHRDHSSCVDKLIGHGLDVYMSSGTAEALELPEKLLELAHGMEAGVGLTIGTMDILPFQVFHDCREPLGFCVQSQVDHDIFAYAIDTVNIPYRFPGVNILAVEANFDQTILDRCERMPEKVRKRISNTHMEIDVLCRCLDRMDLSRCRDLWLMHLSDSTSHEGHFINKVRRHVPPSVKVYACGRE